MREPRRLVQTTRNELAGALLRSAERDVAPPQTSARVATGLGIALPTTLGAVGTKAALASAATAKGGLLGTSMTVVGMGKIVVLSAVCTGSVLLGAQAMVEGVDGRPGRQGAALGAGSATRATRLPSRSAVGAQPDIARQSDQAPLPSIEASSEPTVDSRKGTVLGAEADSTTPGRATVQTPQRPRMSADGSTRESSESAASLPLPASGAPSVPRVAYCGAPAPSARRPEPATEQARPASLQLEREVALLDASRRALSRGRPSEALQLLERHGAEIPGGILRPEGIILRVKALLALGRRADAERAVLPVLREAPQSRHADVLRALLSSAHEHP